MSIVYDNHDDNQCFYCNLGVVTTKIEIKDKIDKLIKDLEINNKSPTNIISNIERLIKVSPLGYDYLLETNPYLFNIINRPPMRPECRFILSKIYLEHSLSTKTQISLNCTICKHSYCEYHTRNAGFKHGSCVNCIKKISLCGLCQDLMGYSDKNFYCNDCYNGTNKKFST